MEIGISTASYFNKMLIEDAITDIAVHGTALMELFLNTFSEYEPDFISLLCERVGNCGGKVYSVHPQSPQFEPQLFSIHSRQRADAISLYEKVLAAGERLGAKVYVMHGPATLNGAARDLGLKRLIPHFLELNERAAAHGITLALENVSWCICNSPEFVTAMRDATADQLHFTLDIKQAVRAGADPFFFVKEMGDKLVNVHLCDYDFTPEGRFVSRMPGDGRFDFSGLGGLLRQNGYAGPAFVEVYSDMYENIAELYAVRDYLSACMNGQLSCNS